MTRGSPNCWDREMGLFQHRRWKDHTQETPQRAHEGERQEKKKAQSAPTQTLNLKLLGLHMARTQSYIARRFTFRRRRR